MEPGVTMGLGKGFQLSFHLPLDLKNTGIEYRLTDGAPYTPPYGNFHHRNETLFGPGDARLMARWTREIPASPVVLGFGLGAALPTGKTEADPFAAASLEEDHQHLQFGGGTVDPLAAFTIIVRSPSIGLLASANTRLPVYANKKGYRGPLQISATVGPTLRLPDPLRSVQLSLLGNFEWSSAESWGGIPGENSGMTAASMRMGLIWNVRPKLAIQAHLQSRVYERSLGAQFSRPVTLTVGVSGFLDLRKLGKKGTEEHKH